MRPTTENSTQKNNLPNPDGKTMAERAEKQRRKSPFHPITARIGIK
ncbi:MAG TPA: hypothetical protein VKS81_01885 [Bacteroidota bacterium]|nr:hypothetical protein [Bacteroidota bacterium]